MIRPLVAGGLLVLLTACNSASGGGLGSSKTAIEEAAEVCDIDASTTLSVADQGETLIGDGVKAGDYADLVCMFLEFDTPSSVTAQMDSTTAMMGSQEASGNGFTYRWSYHPDNGLDIVVTEGD